MNCTNRIILGQNGNMLCYKGITYQNLILLTDLFRLPPNLINLLPVSLGSDRSTSNSKLDTFSSST